MWLPTIQQCAIPAVVTLIAFLAYSSQLLFRNLEPQPLTVQETVIFNVLVAGIFVCYFRACYTDPGRIPPGWTPRQDHDGPGLMRQRWCRKCEATKPPRAHHCKTCKRCVPRMDHHCPWTANCVSHTTFPHFVRFVVYAVTSMVYLECFIGSRLYVLWSKRHLPSYLGPTGLQLGHLFVLAIVNSLVLFALSILLIRTLWDLAANLTTIESWELERHDTLVRRARVLGGYLDGPNGEQVRIVRQEFPYDIGILPNIAAGMGSRNPLSWFWPFAATPSIASGLQFEENGLEDPGTTWPPPDPDRMFRTFRDPGSTNAFTESMDIDDFRRRQQADQVRHRDVRRRQPFHARYDASSRSNPRQDWYGSDNGSDYGDSDGEPESPRIVDDNEGEEAWRNSEGERLGDFGVDEDVEFYDEREDDLPLAELMRKRAVERALAENNPPV